MGLATGAVYALLFVFATAENIKHWLAHRRGYRRDPRVSALFAELLAQAGNLLPPQQRESLVSRALRFNPENGNLQQMLQPRAGMLPSP